MALAGACFGFLWFNCHPARVFMGDTGSLAIGGLLGVVAICTKQELLLVVIGGVFVIEAMSVLIQRTWFKITKAFTAKAAASFSCRRFTITSSSKAGRKTPSSCAFGSSPIMFALLGLATLKLR